MGKTIVETELVSNLRSENTLSAKRRHGRAVNAVADYLRSHLRVPEIYIDPSATSLTRADVLAVDAAGSGDLHAVEIKLLTKPTVTKAMKLHVELVKMLPAHYKYLAIPRNITNIAADMGLFSTNGIGRVGIFLISESGDQFPAVELAVKPERFRVDPDDLARVERFLKNTQPDMRVRL